MADSIRQKIVSQIVSKLSNITTANGYQTNIGANVADWQINWQENELPAVSVCDLVEEFEPLDDEVRMQCTLPVQVRVFIGSNTRASEGRKIIADVLDVVRANQKWNDGTSDLAQWTELKRDGFILDQDAFSMAGIGIDIDIIYYADRFNAYE